MDADNRVPEKNVEIPQPLHQDCKIIALRLGKTLKVYVREKIIEGVNRDRAENPNL